MGKQMHLKIEKTPGPFSPSKTSKVAMDEIRCTFLDFAGLLAAIPRHYQNAILGYNQKATKE